jgi:hypothetical protein
MKWIALFVGGFFVVLASFSCGRYCYTPPERETSYAVAQVEAVNRLVADAGVTFPLPAGHDCGLDMGCLPRWFNEEHPRRRKP